MKRDDISKSNEISHVGYVRRSDGGVWGEVFKSKTGYTVYLISIGDWEMRAAQWDTKEFTDIDAIKDEMGLGGWLYDFQVVVEGHEL